MKNIIRIILVLNFLLISFFAQGQLEENDFNYLVKIGELYSNNPNATGKKFKKSIKALRSPKLEHIVDALILIGKGDIKLLSDEFLKRPDNEELKYWYVIREIHYNLQSEDIKPRPSKEVALEILDKEIDERWLLDNYYYRIRGGIATLFNDNNLSKYNFDLDSYGLKNKTEKAIFFFAIVDALTQRFKVLQMLKNHDGLLQFAEMMPTFNGGKYYHYTDFDFEDFDWIGYDKVESYKERHLGNMYSSLFAHFSTLSIKEVIIESRDVYFKSILFVPKYFKYSAIRKDLEDLYKLASK